MERPLTFKQKTFVAEYMIDKNGAQAAIRAGYSKKTAVEQASRLLTKVNVINAIDKLILSQQKRLTISADAVIEGITRIAKCCEELNDSNKVKDPSNALKAYELLGKHLKLFTEKIEMSVSESRLIKLTTEEKVLKLLENE